MAIDPTDPDTFGQDALGGPEADVEAPENDTAEQHAQLTPEGDDSLEDADTTTANEADLAEQARVVALDEDDYR